MGLEVTGRCARGRTVGESVFVPWDDAATVVCALQLPARAEYGSRPYIFIVN